jgi:hypothetical protein
MAAAAALVAIVPVAAQAQGQAFVTASAGQSHYSVHSNSRYVDSPTGYGIATTSHVDDKDVALGVTGGYRWQLDDVFSIGPEAGLVDLGELSTHGTASSGGPGNAFSELDRGSVKNKAALLGVNAKWMLGDQWSLGLRTGFLHTWTRVRSTVDGTYSYNGVGGTYSGRFRRSSHDNGFYGALNVGYDFTRNFGVTFGYEHYRSDYKTDAGSVNQKIGVWAGSAEFRF